MYHLLILGSSISLDCIFLFELQFHRVELGCRSLEEAENHPWHMEDGINKIFLEITPYTLMMLKEIEY